MRSAGPEEGCADHCLRGGCDCHCSGYLAFLVLFDTAGYHVLEEVGPVFRKCAVFPHRSHKSNTECS